MNLIQDLERRDSSNVYSSKFWSLAEMDILLLDLMFDQAIYKNSLWKDEWTLSGIVLWLTRVFHLLVFIVVFYFLLALGFRGPGAGILDI